MKGKNMKIVAGKNKGKKLKHLKDANVRATSHKVREALFDIILPYIDKAFFLDLFAGTGAIGIEALSRGAEKAFFIENNGKCIKIIHENLNITGNAEYGKIFKSDYASGLRILDKKNYRFDYIFLDPPYNKGLAIKALKEISNMSILKEDGQVIVQHHRREVLENRIDSLKMVKQKHYGGSLLTFFELISLEK